MSNVRVPPNTWVRVMQDLRGLDAVVVGYDEEHGGYLVAFPFAGAFPELVRPEDVVDLADDPGKDAGRPA